MREFILLFVFLISVFQFVKADLIMPGSKPIDYCVRITNVNEFPEYVFLAHLTLSGISRVTPNNQGYQILEENECIDIGYKLNVAELYFVKVKDFNESAIGINRWFDLTEQEKNEVRNRLGFLFNNESTLFGNDSYPREGKQMLANYIYFNYDQDIMKISEKQFGTEYYNMFWNPVKSKTLNIKVVEENGKFSISESTSREYSIGILLEFL